VTRALVIGGGIGGLSVGRALERSGIDATVFERAPELGQIQVGGAIHLWHNGMRGLQRLGLADEVEQVAGRAAAVQTAEMRNWRGRLLTSWSVADVEREVGAPTLGVRRPDLHRVLAGGLKPGALALGHELTAFAQQDGGVVATFADGSEERGDLLIGADGLRSTVRRTLLGDGDLRAAKYASWQAVCGYVGGDAPVGLFRVVWGPGARFLFYHVGTAELYWEGIFTTAPGGSDPPGDHRSAVAARFAGWAEPVPSIIAATEESAITRGDVYDRPPIKNWGEGRVTLLGDAAHPMTNAAGQGANQTIEDAVVLGARLAGAADPVAALRAYEQERIGRSARFATLAWRLTALSRWSRPAAVAVRDPLVSAMMVVGKRAQRKDMAYEF
jgi:2-polyprenyl-6-methoxyphenol hydroxylase-like FAD-dependent oxidoreductase